MSRGILSFDSLASTGRSVWQLFYTHNPLYLVSACFVLHGMTRWMPGSSATLYNPWPLIALSFTYILLLAATALAIVRLGGVWEDARSIVLIIAGLFVELSMTFDDPISKGIAAGTTLALVGYFFAVAVSEALLYGLRIRLPRLYRVPFHAMLALVMLYPLVLGPSARGAEWVDVSWRIYLFSPLAALVLASLLPAVRRGRDYVADNGTPWSWPWYPWPLFCFLGAAMCMRGYVLSLSFDPVLSIDFAAAMRLESAYGSYFLVPILMAAALLLLEAGLVARSEIAKRLGLLIPLVCVFLSLPVRSGSIPYGIFLNRFVDDVASPLFLSVLGAVCFYGVAWGRGVRFAEELTLGAVGMLAWTQPRSDDFAWSIASPLLLWTMGVWLFGRGWQALSSIRVLVGACVMILALQVGPLSDWPRFWQWVVPGNLYLAVLLLVSLIFRDLFARWVRRVAAGSFALTGFIALFAPVEMPPELPSGSVAVYVMCIICVLVACGYVLRDMWYWSCGFGCLSAWFVSMGWQSYAYLRVFPEWRAVRSFAIGFVLLVLAASISAVKGGVWRKLTRLLPSGRVRE